MLDTPRILQTTTQHIASIRLTVPWADMMKVMGPGLAELNAAVEAQGVAVTGPWLSHHFRKPTDTFDFEICLPVVAPIVAAGRVQPGTLQARKVARTVYHGGYEGLGNAWGEFRSWLAANNHTTADDFWECYRVGPEAGSDATKWQTELTWPLV